MKIDPEIFFDPKQEAEAIEFCHNCPIMLACANYAIQENLEGVWGGTTEAERRSLRNKKGSRKGIQNNKTNR
jgi:WhiB family redox-sensing transcriptional regulator